jgi:hypothetical protein
MESDYEDLLVWPTREDIAAGRAFVGWVNGGHGWSAAASGPTPSAVQALLRQRFGLSTKTTVLPYAVTPR